jgi:hypothetical protein
VVFAAARCRADGQTRGELQGHHERRQVAAGEHDAGDVRVLREQRLDVCQRLEFHCRFVHDGPRSRIARRVGSPSASATRSGSNSCVPLPQATGSVGVTECLCGCSDAPELTILYRARSMDAAVAARELAASQAVAHQRIVLDGGAAGRIITEATMARGKRRFMRPAWRITAMFGQWRAHWLARYERMARVSSTPLSGAAPYGVFA